ncbi:unnamed protein product [Haemonchus placei]|uniref:Resolvase/invertase-type recombinase catalytic domain-containing protein n=1 Tax=Haemonchus placei TaxID=6290 RepID=A0A0N4X8A6_HAEPC|nr:unnamed protein product [Haemonchus placei]
MNLGQSSLGYVIEGYPRNVDQLRDLQSLLGRIDLAILIDCTERFCMETVANRVLACNTDFTFCFSETCLLPMRARLLDSVPLITAL